MIDEVQPLSGRGTEARTKVSCRDLASYFTRSYATIHPSARTFKLSVNFHALTAQYSMITIDDETSTP